MLFFEIVFQSPRVGASSSPSGIPGLSKVEKMFQSPRVGASSSPQWPNFDSAHRHVSIPSCRGKFFTRRQDGLPD